MSRTHPTPIPIPTDNAAGFVANFFRSTACVEETFHQEGGELQNLENCWSDSAVLQFIILGWIGIFLNILLLVVVATFFAACIQGRRPWYVFLSFVKGMGRAVGGLCSCFELIDEEGEGEGETAGEVEKSLGIAWEGKREGGNYFGCLKEKVLSRKLERNLTNMLILMKGLILLEVEETEARGRQTMLARKETLEIVEEKEKQGTMSTTMNHHRRRALQFASQIKRESWYKMGQSRKDDLEETIRFLQKLRENVKGQKDVDRILQKIAGTAETTGQNRQSTRLETLT